MHKAFFILAKAQLLRETRKSFDGLREASYGAACKEFIDHLRYQEASIVKEIQTEERMDEYIGRTRRMSLQEWLDSLDFDHTQNQGEI